MKDVKEFWSSHVIILLLGVGIIIILIFNIYQMKNPLPLPTPTVTATSVSTKTIEVEVVPQECKAALNAADDAFDIAGQGFNLAAESVDAAVNRNVAKLSVANEKLDALLPQLQSALNEYKMNRDMCRSR